MENGIALAYSADASISGTAKVRQLIFTTFILVYLTQQNFMIFFPNISTFSPISIIIGILN